MRKMLYLMMACICMTGCLFVNVKATEFTMPGENCEVLLLRATGSFNMSIGANKRTMADKSLPLEVGETVRIYATYSPDNASIDFGLIDPEGVFHFLNATTGVIDETIEVPQKGNYKLAFRNNSEEIVRISGFVKY